MNAAERIWFGSGVAAAAIRTALRPLAGVYGLGVWARNILYDREILAVRPVAMPVVSIGNLTVGGTGKTPFAAWAAGHLRSNGGRPAIVLRGYGDDETLVHERLNPGIPVIAGADRVAAARRAAAAGADILVLDDAFQHRRIARTLDVVLVSAEQLMRPRRLLPAGPWRERLGAVSRGDIVVVTRKAATLEAARAAVRDIRERHDSLPIAIAHLAPAELVSVEDGATLPLGTLKDANVAALAGVGEPENFRRQLEDLGARVSLRAFPDHHRFAQTEIDDFAATVGHGAIAVCTLKDAVKIQHRWPGPGRLWYVSQRLAVEQGAETLERLLQRALDARVPAAITAG